MSMASIVNRVNRRIDTQIRKSTIELFGSVIKMTPVDTGRAKGNWQCTIGSPATSEIERDDGSKKDSLSSSKAYEEVVKTVPRSGNVVWLSNNVPYIRNLEYGSSQQALSGMVRVSLERFGSIFADNATKSLSQIK
jgi:hypothetical protein